MHTSVQTTTSIVQFDTLLHQAAIRAIVTYPAEECRIWKGYLIAQQGGVALQNDGTAIVQSQTRPDETYHVNGACECKDTRAPGGRCKHRWGKSIYKSAYKSMLTVQAPQQYYATYYPPSGDIVPGIAEWSAKGWLFTSDDGSVYDYLAIQALALGGRCDLSDQQVLLDGSLVEKVCHQRKGYDQPWKDTK